mgnify:CR=1 FL=1
MRFSYLFFLGICGLFISAGVKLPKALRSEYQFIPSGLALLDNDTVSLQAYYMLNHEVTNGEYAAFLEYLKENGTDQDLEAARIRNENWNKELKCVNTKYAELYHTHPAYKDYPVVNVTHEGTQLYCIYASKLVNELLAKTGMKVNVRLPHRAELIRAGAGDDLARPYSWGGQYLKNAQGSALRNYVQIPEGALTRDENGKIITSKDYKHNFSATSTNADVVAPKHSYWPSPYGIYNLNGNVAEMTQEKHSAVGGSWRDLGWDVRLQSVKHYEEVSCTVGFRTVFSWVVSDEV